MKVLIADTTWLSQDGLATLLADIESEAEIFRTSDMVGLRRILDNHADIALVFIDDALTAGDDAELFPQIRGDAPDAEIVLWTNGADRERYMKAIHFGAVGILLKSAPTEETAAALQLLLSGQCAYPRGIIAAGPTEHPTPPARRREEESLTPREREVMDAIGQGQTVARIAETFAVSPHTIRVHVTRIMKKLDLHDRPSLMYYAIKHPRRRSCFEEP